MTHATKRHPAGFLAMLLIGTIGGSLGCSTEMARRSAHAILAPDTAQGPNRLAVDARRHGDDQDGRTPPSGLTTASFGTSSLVLWPYTGESLDGTPSDP